MTTMVLVAVVAMLAGEGVRKYVTHSKTTEATNMIGGIAAAVKIAFYHERMSGEIVAPGSGVASSLTQIVSVGGGSQGKGATHTHHAGLCDDSLPVPASLTSIQGQKYQPKAADYNSGDTSNGWQCLFFHTDEPQYFQYQYLSSSFATVSRPHGMGPPPGQAGIPNGNQWAVIAHGDLDGDGVTSYYALYGGIAAAPLDEVVVAPGLDVIDEDE
jgi:type IV pilus assembly protein PilA